MIKDTSFSKTIFEIIRKKCKVSEFRSVINQFNKIHMNIYDNNGNTPLMAIIRTRNVPLASYYIKTLVSDLDLKNKKTGETALEIANKFNLKSIVKLINKQFEFNNNKCNLNKNNQKRKNTIEMFEKPLNISKVFGGAWASYYSKILSEPKGNCEILISPGTCSGISLIPNCENSSCCVEIKVNSLISDKIESVSILKTPEFIDELINLVFKHYQITVNIRKNYQESLKRSIADARLYIESLNLK